MAEIKRKLRPFTVPNYVGVEMGAQEPVSIPLSELDREALEELCEEFVDAVFTKAGVDRAAYDGSPNGPRGFGGAENPWVWVLSVRLREEASK